MSDKQPSRALKILIADDHVLVRKGLRQILFEASAGQYVVVEASDGLQAIEMALSDDWDIIILDISMPGANGLEVLEVVKRAKPNVPILMLSMHAGPPYVQQALRKGASAYLTKETAPDELMTALRRVLAGEKYVSGQSSEPTDDTA